MGRLLEQKTSCIHSLNGHKWIKVAVLDHWHFGLNVYNRIRKFKFKMIQFLNNKIELRKMIRWFLAEKISIKRLPKGVDTALVKRREHNLQHFWVNCYSCQKLRILIGEKAVKLNCLFLDSATMENAMSWDAKRSVALSCPPRKVIYAPRVAVGTSTDTKCRGISPRLLVRRNECYWRQNCTLSWRGPALLAMSTSPRCYGRTGDVLLTKGHTCVNKGNANLNATYKDCVFPLTHKKDQ